MSRPVVPRMDSAEISSASSSTARSLDLAADDISSRAGVSA